MESSMNFTLGLSQGIAWPWPIAVYLFLAGISGGAVAIAIFLNMFKGKLAEDTPVLKAASLIGLGTILLGMLCLVCDLTNPLVFWRILIYYNPTSVMSLGVMALLLYIPLVAVLMVIALRKELKNCPLLGWVGSIGEAINGLRYIVQVVVLVLALTICAYTGFLISALIRFPLINTAVLPALFVASGLSAGAACAKLFAVGLFGDSIHSADMHALHKAEWPIMIAEALCIFMIAVALIYGNAAAQAAVCAFVEGTWASVFWIGVVGVGFIVPILLGIVTQSAATFFLSGIASVCGMMCLRMFILYAGQLHAI